MKTKTFKKLALSKVTITNLQNADMKEAYGGATEKTVCNTILMTNCLRSRCLSNCTICNTDYNNC